MNADAAVQGHQYDTAFFTYTDGMAVRSAQLMLPIVERLFPVRSVADFGCGNGGWLHVWKKLGVRDCVGIDGDYVDRDRLLIEKSEFISHDLSRPLNLRRKFDLVQSLEVAEHLPPSSSEAFVDTLVAHADVILFSAAAPGQGGMRHINERSYGFWRELFQRRGYVMLDAIRPAIQNLHEIQPWYRYNSFVFVNRSKYDKLDGELRSSRVADDRPVRDVSPRFYQFRKQVIRILPVGVVDRLSILNTAWANRINRRTKTEHREADSETSS